MSGKNQKRDLSPGEKRFFCLGVFTIALLLCSIFPQSAQSRTWYIKADGTGDAPTIQAGVDSAAAGDTVMVGAGTYSDATTVLVDGQLKTVNVYIGKGLSVLAESFGGKPLIDGSESDIAVYVFNVEAKIVGFEIVTTFASFGCIIPSASHTAQNVIWDDVGVRCDGGGVTVRNCVVHDHRWAVVFNRAVGCVEDTDVYRAELGVVCLPGSVGEVVDNSFHYCGASISADSSVIWVTGNEFTPGAFLTCDGIELSNATQATIVDNHFVNLYDVGINCGDVANATIERNHFDGCHTAIQSITGRSVVVRENVFVSHYQCMNLFDVNDWDIEGNTIDDGGLAVVCQGAATNGVRFRQNIITRYGGGVFCAFGAIVQAACNDFSEVASPFAGDCPDQVGIEGNFALDPEYCGIDDSDNYFLQSDSPCAPGNHPDGYNCGLIGALPVNCGKVAAKKHTWGSVKSLYENRGEN